MSLQVTLHQAQKYEIRVKDFDDFVSLRFRNGHDKEISLFICDYDCKGLSKSQAVALFRENLDRAFEEMEMDC